jgi:CRP/FNR family transcriptional regulator
MSQRDYQKDSEQLPGGVILSIAARVAAKAKSNWLSGKDERDVAKYNFLSPDKDAASTNFHFRMLGVLGNALANGNFNEAVAMVEEEGRTLANQHISLQLVMDNASACLGRWIKMILDEAEQESPDVLQPRFFQGLVRRINHLQSRLMIALLAGYNEQVESGEVWLHRPAEHENNLRVLMNHHRNTPEHFFELLTTITGEYAINRYRAGMPIFSDNHDIQRSRFYFIRGGTVQIQEYLPDGRALTLTILGRGDVFARFTGATRNANANYFRDFQAETMRETELVWVEEAALLRAMERSPVLAASIIKSFSMQLASVQQLIQGLLGRDVAVRLAHLLLKLADEFGVSKGDGGIYIDYPLSHQRLADMMGSNRVTVTRQLSELQKQNILMIQRRSITLYNRRLLEATGS